MSTSNMITEEMVRKYNKSELLDFLRKEKNSLELDEDDLEIIRREKINGRNFLKVNVDRLIYHGMKLGPAMTLIEFANDIKESQALNERIRKLESEKVQLNQQLNDLILYKKFVIPSYNNLWLNFGSEWNQEEAQKIIDEVSTEYLGPKKIIVNSNCFNSLKKHNKVESYSKFNDGCFNFSDEAYSNIEIIKKYTFFKI
ncbi:hypothetical protein GLOIN_2v1773369 [Rhizophagus irregularis DAOM 181602=DAOM 197198]|uniref:Uncharacterized protein n=1 Tax=Rhizophagus irregularis (strain DAOM 181602 / DAOM 197198 / MUCL 43194) TaxID=747089 RepID=A0A2P4Q500_RHIID|nr:hypothetical protein GLOIN_2v1773369 [Rhizophagus irregularis DAOM 181602=DAOM 197198]POG72729.1 hypothetical protein GLOIN_2v1773369 [Rhizophagus irregularis DAOM 181602=DAOM 197198]|eukprot:XP_025179595.1 hypothetical protein GLOIN_2v1773369 [Rhizophagus irregularis DAOM 181602=DAOM 197198]